MRKIRIIACDLDGTLLTDTNEITPETMESVRSLKRLGIELLLLSGRSDGFIRRYAEQINSPLPIISLNGALVRDGLGKFLSGSFIDQNVGQLIVNMIGQDRDASISIFTVNETVSTSFPLRLPLYLRAFPNEHRKVEIIERYFDTALMYVISAPFPVIQDISVSLARKFGGELERISYQSKKSEDYYLEIKNRYVNKGTALRFVADYMKLDRKEIGAIGDYLNDIEMCKFAGVSAAMRNAVSELKGAVDFVTRKTNNEGGTSEFFNLVCQAQKENA